MISVAIIEDHPVFRRGLAEAVEQAPDMRVSVVADSVERFLERALDRPDVIILDLGLPGGLEGASAVHHLRSMDLAVLVVSVEDREAPVLDAIAAGARGYLTKTSEPDEIIRAVNAVAAGDMYVSPTLASYLLKEPVRLTEREKEVLRLLATGETDQDIADQLVISVRTVHGHLEEIRAKTGRKRRVPLTLYALERGLVPRFPRKG